MRVICATNADLRQMVAEKDFREDLFYRISLITLHLPPLRERVEDIPLLVNHFAKLLYSQNGAKPAIITDDAMDFLKGLPYSGNIRELKNLVERTLLINDSPRLNADAFRREYKATCAMNINTENTPSSLFTLEEVERQTIAKALEQYRGNLSQVAQSLGITRQALYRRMEKYSL